MDNGSFAHPGPRRLGEMGCLGGDNLGRGAISETCDLEAGYEVSESPTAALWRLEVLGDDGFWVDAGWWTRGRSHGSCRCNQGMTGFLIELRSSGYPEQLESKLQVGGPQERRSYLGTISATPPATDIGLKSSLDPVEAEDLGVDDFDVGSALHAPLEDAACRVQLPHTSQRPNCSALTNPTQLPRNTPLRWAAQMDAMADRHGAGTMAGEQWGYGARALGPELRRK
ncbi:hypothetical protein B0H14DRAFT_2617026 [Mycena olivaceomarginata]|nr:hypothetical protein B0H14DRAFT_2617026 [Mycena olivaceomarginata]